MTSLIQGIDNDTVTATIFLDMPFGFLNFRALIVVAMMGRSPGLSFCYQKKTGTLAKDKPGDDDIVCNWEAKHWMQAEECQCLEFIQTME